MAILSNINGKFAVDSSGAIQLSGSAGTANYVLVSGGAAAAPTWVAGSTVIGGPYLLLSGGTLTGATATSAGISFTVGGALTGTTANFTDDVSIGVYTSTDTGSLLLNGSTANQQSVLKCTNGNLHIDAASTFITYINYYTGSGGITFGNGAGAASGASVSSTGIVYATSGNSTEWNTGYDNSITGLAVTGTTTKTLTATQQDGGTLTATWTDINTEGVTSVGSGNGLTGGTITSTGTLAMSGSYTGTFTTTDTIQGYGLTSQNKRGNSGKIPQGHYAGGETVWEMDNTWSSQQLADYFNASVSSVYWTEVADAPGGNCIYINGGVNVGGVYGSGFPYLPVETNSASQADYYMELWIQNVGTSQTHYMGSNEFNQSFGSLGGNPGSYGYWVMSNSNPGTGWTKYSAYIGGFGNSVGQFEVGTKYWTPMALLNYGAGSGTRACRISGWKVIKVQQPGKRSYDGVISATGGNSTQWNTAYANQGNYLPLAGGTMTGAINMGANEINNVTEVYNNSWFRNNNSSQGLYNQSTGNHWYSDGAYWNTGINATQGIRLRNGHAGAIMGTLYSETSGQFGLLDKDGNWTFRTDGATVTELRCNDVIGLSLNASGGVTFTGIITTSGTITSNAGNSPAFICGPNSSYGAGTELYLGGWGSSGTYSWIRNSNGNLHMDHRNGYTTYVNHYVTGDWYVGNGGGSAYAYNSFRAPIFYDSADTAYLLNPNGNSQLSSLMCNAGITINGSENLYLTTNYGQSIVGLYSASKYQGIFAMGNAYKLPIDGSGTGSLYGICYSHPNAGGAAANLSDHGMLLLQSGAYRAAISGSIRCITDMRAPIYYDSDNTAYNVNPASTSNLNTISLKSQIDLPGGATSSAGSIPAYSIYQTGGAWTYPYPDLNLAMHTGIRLGANSSYGGIRFYNDYNMVTQVMSVNNASDGLGAGNVYINDKLQVGTDVRAPIYYDVNNTAYYTRPATSSNINSLYTAGLIQAGASGSGDIYIGGTSSNYFRFHLNNSDSYFDMNCGNVYWRQGASTRFYFYAGTANMTINGSLTQNSDERVKENIVEISDCIDKVKAIRGVYYNRTDFNTEVTKVGVIAQEVEKVLPEVILEAPDTGLKSVAYAELTPVLVNALKEQQVIIDDLKSRIEILENN